MPHTSSVSDSGDQPAVANPPRWRRIAVSLAVPLMVTLVVVLTGGLAAMPIRDAATHGPVVEAYLVRPLSYVVLAPLSNVLDTLTLLSVRQHAALLVGVIVLFAIWRGWRHSGAGWKRHLAASGVLLVTIVLVYALGTLVPRPMARLVTNNSDFVIVDFHSHTDASHDGHQSVQQSRKWHANAGYNVAYVTDHGTVAAAERAMAANPAIGADGTIMLQGVEVTWNREHTGILSAERTFKGLRTNEGRDLDPEALQLASLFPGTEPVVVWHHPHDLSRVPAYSIDTAGVNAGVSAIEIANGAPNDMDALRDNHTAILAFAQQHDLALTSGTDNHGWGFAAPAWTMLQIRGWRGMNPDILGTAIENVLRFGGFKSTKVVERRVADPGRSTGLLALSVLTIPYRMLTTLSAEERGAWIVWTWALVCVVWWWRRRRRPSDVADAA